MIMDLPERFSSGNAKQKDAYIENGILKIRRSASLKKVVYELVFLLNGGKHECKYCNKKNYNAKVTIDHLYPQDMGGPTITNNLLPSCESCNREKSNMTCKEYKKYLELKKEDKHKPFFKTLNETKEEMKKRKEYQIPKEWICEKPISTILVEFRLGDSTQTKKYEKVKKFYLQYGYLQKPIVIDKNGYLLDGFYTVVFAKDYKITTIPAIQLENVEVIF